MAGSSSLKGSVSAFIVEPTASSARRARLLLYMSWKFTVEGPLSVLYVYPCCSSVDSAVLRGCGRRKSN